MVDFNNLPKRTRKDCAECGEEFRGTEEESLCFQCAYWKENPEDAPGYFTWARDPDDGWVAQARWRDLEPPPKEGQTITVHRKDGTTQQKTVAKPWTDRYNMDGTRIIRCLVK